MSETKQIAKNTIIVYIRLFITTIIGLITSRFVLQILGVSDYGLYHVVGGVIALFSFVSGSLSATTIRFLNVEIGKQDGEPNKVFNVCNVIHIAFAILLLVLAETIGVFYINNYLNVEPGKEYDAMFVFQVSTIVACMGLINVPYSSTFIAKERFFTIALIDIISSLIKLFAIIGLFYYKGNVLRAYAILMSLTTLFSFIIYHYLSYKKWPELVRWKYVNKWDDYKQVLAFNNYNLLATISIIGRDQGSNILINFFFGTIVNGAYGIAKTVQSFVAAFMANFDSAAAPKINQYVGGGNNEAAQSIVFPISRYCFLMMILVFFPLYAETEFVLKLWLGVVPDYSVIFCQLLLIVVLVSSTAGGMLQYINASGKIKWFKLQSCFWSLIILPIAFYLFKMGWEPWWIFILSILSDILNRSCQLILMKKLLGYDSISFIKKAWLKPGWVILIMTIYLIIYMRISLDGMLIHLIGITLTFILTALTVWFVGLYKEERDKIYTMITVFIKSKKHD